MSRLFAFIRDYHLFFAGYLCCYFNEWVIALAKRGRPERKDEP